MNSLWRTAWVLTGVVAGVLTCALAGQSGITPSRFAPPPALSAPTPVLNVDRVPNIYDAQRKVEEYVGSGRYDGDVAKVVASARAWLDKRIKTAVKPAIVLDIDETSLSNWPAFRVNGWASIVNGGCDLKQGPCGVRAWQAMGQSKALAPTLALSRHAHELGVGVFFISGRPSRLREAAQNNLREQGYDWTALILMPDNAHFESAADFKAPERRKISEQGYTILLNLGDQWSALSGGYAERTFKLPNPVYYIP